MSEHYDVVVIGAGHYGLVYASLPDIQGSKPAHHSYIYAGNARRNKDVGFITSATPSSPY